MYNNNDVTPSVKIYREALFCKLCGIAIYKEGGAYYIYIYDIIIFVDGGVMYL